MNRRITLQDVTPFFPRRKKDTHKGSYGHVLLVGGSADKPGSILMAGRSALRSGAGLVTVALPMKAFQRVDKNFLELMYAPFSSLRKILEGKNAVGVGPGMGTGSGAVSVLNQLLKTSQDLVIDADALNILSARFRLMKTLTIRRGASVLTPHPLEMARLLGTSSSKVQAERIGVARQFATLHRVILVLKGARTVVAWPDGTTWVNATANPVLATAGMGDVLTGLIASLMAQGIEARWAAVCGVFVHGAAAEALALRMGTLGRPIDRGLIATDVI